MLQFHLWTDMTMDKKPTYRAPALDKGLDILEILARTFMMGPYQPGAY